MTSLDPAATTRRVVRGLRRRLGREAATPAATAGPTGPRGGPRSPGTFLLGVGCQKGGTSWLFDYLAASPQSDMGFRKEYHVFDAMDLPEGARFRDQVLDKAAREIAKARQGVAFDAEALRRAGMWADQEMYVDYFTGLLMARRRTRLTGDITPTYAMLPAERLASIRTGFERRGVRPVAVFLMRDPVERIFSQIRMQERRSGEAPGTRGHEALLAAYADGEFASRTRYDLTLASLDDAFDADQLWLGFYERLFAEEQVRSLCETLRIDYHRPSFEQRVNASNPATEGLPDDVVRIVSTHHRGVYEAVARRFPEQDLHAIWPSSRFVL